MKFTRSSNNYVDLPDFAQEKNLKTARASVSITVNVPKDMEKSAKKFMADMEEDFNTSFKAYIKKRLRKMENEDV